jgi:predicted ATPase
MREKPPLTRIALRRETVTDWSAYPFTVPVVRAFDRIDVKSRVLCFVGENGTGKSTLLEAIAEYSGFALAGGSPNMTAPLARTSHVAALADALVMSWTSRVRPAYFLRAESFTDVATYLDDIVLDDPRAYQPYGGKSLHAQSHGESFFSLFLHRINSGGLYLMDEPEAALSYARQLALVLRIRDLLAAHPATQFIIASHSPIILAFPGAQLVNFDGERLHEVTFRETDGYVVGSRFFADPERYMRHLLDDADDGGSDTTS